jgi:hypothetical protein
VFSTLSQRFSGKTSIWIQDQSLVDPEMRVSFDEAKIFRYSKYFDVYGLHLKEHPWSTPLSDERDLLVLLDFQNPRNPQPHIRPWHTGKVSEELKRLNDFKVIN